MKDIVLVVVILLTVGLSVMVVRFNDQATKAKKSLDEEKYSRMVAEESLQKNSARVTTLEAQLKTATDKMAKIQDILEQEKGVNQDLKRQYEQLSQSKAELEAKLDEAVKATSVSEVVQEAVPVEEQANVPATAEEVVVTQ